MLKRPFNHALICTTTDCRHKLLMLLFVQLMLICRPLLLLLFFYKSNNQVRMRNYPELTMV